MPFNYAVIPKLAKAEAVTQWQFQNVFCTLKKQHISIKRHAADSYVPEIKFSYLVSFKEYKDKTAPQASKDSLQHYNVLIIGLNPGHVPNLLL